MEKSYRGDMMSRMDHEMSSSNMEADDSMKVDQQQ
jgi:hypothetical protein